MRTPSEIEREGRRILRRLTVKRTGLWACDGERFAVARSQQSAALSRVTVEGDCVRAFLARGWIAPDGPGRFLLSAVGSAFLAQGGEDGFAAQHRLMTTRPGPPGGAPLAVNAGESPLARLAFKDLIDPVQFAAGEKLRRDFTLAQMTPRMDVDLSAPMVSGSRGGGRELLSDTALAASQRFASALKAVGPELADLLLDVCCHLVSLELSEMRRSWSKRSGRVVLKIALDRLADHYGMRVTRLRGAIRGWTMEDSAAGG